LNLGVLLVILFAGGGGGAVVALAADEVGVLVGDDVIEFVVAGPKSLGPGSLILVQMTS
jgi:hypothetical protein